MRPSEPFHILVVDDIPEFVQTLGRILTDAGFAVTQRLSPLQALKEVRRRSFDLLITTLVMRELGGFDVIRGVRNGGSNIPIMMITGFGNERAAIEAMRLGACDYMNKPVVAEELVARVRRILQPSRGSLAAAPPQEIEELITADPAMRSVLELVKTVAATPSRVLILGETGTGKQLVARAIHNGSPRRNEPLVDVNCAAIPDALLESELFGHERGAFTGADRRRIGRFEEAAKGTIFLDEIGEMGYGVQSKLLKVLQSGKFNRVGGNQVLQCQARVLAASNRDLEKEVADGRFRTDLFYRLHVVTIMLPPLRRRQGDVPLLAEHFLKRFSGDGAPHRFSTEALAAMMRYNWPGNVRELENLVERIAVLRSVQDGGPTIGLDALPQRIVQEAAGSMSSGFTFSGNFRDAKERFERDYVLGVLAKNVGNLAAAARMAGMDRSQFFRLVKRLGLHPNGVAMVDSSSTG
jgi:DNA-binding NtrC family response regulator